MKVLLFVSVAIGTALTPTILHNVLTTASEGKRAHTFTSQHAANIAYDSDRTAYYGDLHLHTSYSFDAYLAFNARADPEAAYRFAQGRTVTFLGETVLHSSPPLDFMAVTDHSEWMGVANTASPEALEQFTGWAVNPQAPTGTNTRALEHTAWLQTIHAANRNYVPGKFTTFIAYEWTGNPGGRHAHRNVIFRGDSAPPPFTGHDSKRPEDLWSFLEQARRQGHEAIAVPHNSNWSNGLQFDWVQSEGKPIEQDYAMRQAVNEPLIEIVQNKGTSETHPQLSSIDEFAGFEIWDHDGFSAKAGNKPGSYVRDGLGRGLTIGRKVGTNPFKHGFVGGSDFHNGLSDAAESAYNGPLGPHYPLGATAKFQSQVEASLSELSSGGLTGVWAESNTRESIFAALRRKETFATSGTRLRLRFFGGRDFASSLFKRRRWAKEAYRQGIPMGGDLRLANESELAPEFAIWAVKDPNGANLDRIQVIKVWLDDDRYQEKIFEVALSNGRKVDPTTGKAPEVGNTVDLDTGTYLNSIGATELSAIWKDPQFDPKLASVYYLRVLEIPTPRWTTILSVKQGVPLPEGVPPTIQERGWSSPIWYTP